MANKMQQSWIPPVAQWFRDLSLQDIEAENLNKKPEEYTLIPEFTKSAKLFKKIMTNIVKGTTMKVILENLPLFMNKRCVALKHDSKYKLKFKLKDFTYTLQFTKVSKHVTIKTNSVRIVHPISDDCDIEGMFIYFWLVTLLSCFDICVVPTDLHVYDKNDQRIFPEFCSKVFLKRIYQFMVIALESKDGFLQYFVKSHFTMPLSSNVETFGADGLSCDQTRIKRAKVFQDYIWLKHDEDENYDWGFEEVALRNLLVDELYQFSLRSRIYGNKSFNTSRCNDSSLNQKQMVAELFGYWLVFTEKERKEMESASNAVEEKIIELKEKGVFENKTLSQVKSVVVAQKKVVDMDVRLKDIATQIIQKSPQLMVQDGFSGETMTTLNSTEEYTKKLINQIIGETVVYASAANTNDQDQKAVTNDQDQKAVIDQQIPSWNEPTENQQRHQTSLDELLDEAPQVEAGNQKYILMSQDEAPQVETGNRKLNIIDQTDKPESDVITADVVMNEVKAALTFSQNQDQTADVIQKMENLNIVGDSDKDVKMTTPSPTKLTTNPSPITIPNSTPFNLLNTSNGNNTVDLNTVNLVTNTGNSSVQQFITPEIKNHFQKLRPPYPAQPVMMRNHQGSPTYQMVISPLQPQMPSPLQPQMPLQFYQPVDPLNQPQQTLVMISGEEDGGAPVLIKDTSKEELKKRCLKMKEKLAAHRQKLANLKTPKQTEVQALVDAELKKAEEVQKKCQEQQEKCLMDAANSDYLQVNKEIDGVVDQIVQLSQECLEAVEDLSKNETKVEQQFGVGGDAEFGVGESQPVQYELTNVPSVEFTQKVVQKIGELIKEQSLEVKQGPQPTQELILNINNSSEQHNQNQNQEPFSRLPPPPNNLSDRAHVEFLFQDLYTQLHQVIQQMKSNNTKDNNQFSCQDNQFIQRFEREGVQITESQQFENEIQRLTEIRSDPVKQAKKLEYLQKLFISLISHYRGKVSVKKDVNGRLNYFVEYIESFMEDLLAGECESKAYYKKRCPQCTNMGPHHVNNCFHLLFDDSFTTFTDKLSEKACWNWVKGSSPSRLSEKASSIFSLQVVALCEKTNLMDLLVEWIIKYMVQKQDLNFNQMGNEERQLSVRVLSMMLIDSAKTIDFMIKFWSDYFKYLESVSFTLLRDRSNLITVGQALLQTNTKQCRNLDKMKTRLCHLWRFCVSFPSSASYRQLNRFWECSVYRFAGLDEAFTEYAVRIAPQKNFYTFNDGTEDQHELMYRKGQKFYEKEYNKIKNAPIAQIAEPSQSAESSQQVQAPARKRDHKQKVKDQEKQDKQLKKKESAPPKQIPLRKQPQRKAQQNKK